MEGFGGILNGLARQLRVAAQEPEAGLRAAARTVAGELERYAKQFERLKGVEDAEEESSGSLALFDSTEYRPPPRPLYQVPTSCTATLSGHLAAIRAACALDSDRVASASDDGLVKVWSLTTLDCLATLEGHPSRVWCITTLSPVRLASGGEDHSVRIWDCSTKSAGCLHTLRGHAQRVWCVAAVGAQRLATGSEDRTVRIWDSWHGSCLAELPCTGFVLGIAVLGAERFATTSSDKTVRLWSDTGSGWEPAAALQHNGEVACVTRLSPVDDTLVSGSGSAINLWSIKGRKCIGVFRGHTDTIFSISSVLPGVRIASASKDRTVKLWDVKTRECLITLRGHKDAVYGVVMLEPSSQGRLLSACGDGKLRLWGRPDA